MSDFRNPSGDELNPSSKKYASSYASQAQIFGKVATHIGTGTHAKNSFVWYVLRASFVSAAFLVILVFIYKAWFYPEPTPFVESVKLVWDIFAPLVTLALGYAFGRNEE